MSEASGQESLGQNLNDRTLGLTYGPAADLFAGQVVAEKYKVLGELGRGGMGVVYRVEQLTLGRILAMKTLHTHEVTDLTWRRFQVEAKTAAMLDHPNLITVHDCGLIDGDIPFFVMDYIEGTTLAKLLKDKGALSLEEALTVFIQVCFALSYAHTMGVIHRDLKPSNIMLVPPQSDSSGLSVKVVDFGIAKLTDEEIQPTQALTRTGEIFGSPLYMSPEQCLGKPVDHRSDIYSLGCVLFESLTGVPPFMGSTALSTMMQHQSGEVPSLKEATLGKEFPAAIENILRLMLEKNPESRYQDMKSIARDLSLLQQGISHHPQILPPTKSEISARKGYRHVLQIAAAALIGALAAGTFVYSSMSQQLAATYQAGFDKAKSETKPDGLPGEDLDSVSYGPISSISIDKEGHSVRTFNFGSAKNFGLGYIFTMDTQKSYPAKGVLSFPIEQPLRLDVEDKLIVTHPKFLLRFNANEFTGMRFRFNFGVGNKTFKYLDRQKSLQFLDLTGCEVDDSLIETLNKLPNLNGLKLGKTAITGDGLIKLKRLKQLKTLSLSGLSNQTAVLRKLKGSTELEELRLSADDVSPQDLSIIGTFKNLRKLWIEKNRISDRDLSWICNLKNLQEFCAPESKISFQKASKTILQLPNLNLFRINSKSWTKKDFVLLRRDFPKFAKPNDNRPD
ncbi:MAG: protein kinase [Candidatus Obscuribacterales bacterium]|nr:protein kinase [Candidatus Obscuribacterales bacterium]